MNQQEKDNYMPGYRMEGQAASSSMSITQVLTILLLTTLVNYLVTHAQLPSPDWKIMVTTGKKFISSFLSIFFFRKNWHIHSSATPQRIPTSVSLYISYISTNLAQQISAPLPSLIGLVLRWQSSLHPSFSYTSFFSWTPMSLMMGRTAHNPTEWATTYFCLK